MRKTENVTFKTNNDIVEFLFRNNYFNTISRDYKLNQYTKDDLISIVIEYLLTKEDGYLVDLYERDKLLGYLKNMMYQQYSSKSSKFYKQILKFDKQSDEIYYQQEYDEENKINYLTENNYNELNKLNEED